MSGSEEELKKAAVKEAELLDALKEPVPPSDEALAEGKPKPAEGEPKPAEGEPKPAEGEPKTAEGDEAAAEGDEAAAEGGSNVLGGKKKTLKKMKKGGSAKKMKKGGKTAKNMKKGKSAKKQKKFSEATLQAYCVKCRAKVDINNGKVVTMKNKRKAMKGTCMACGTKVFRIM